MRDKHETRGPCKLHVDSVSFIIGPENQHGV